MTKIERSDNALRLLAAWMLTNPKIVTRDDRRVASKVLDSLDCLTPADFDVLRRAEMRMVIS